MGSGQTYTYPLAMLTLKAGAPYNALSSRLGDRMANEMGKKYACGACGAQFVVTQAGSGVLTCCGQPAERK